MPTSKPSVLFLPKWYPHEFDWFDGNFIENHAHAIKAQAKLAVLFVHSDANLKEGYRIEERENKGIYELKIFYPKPNTALAWLDKLMGGIAYAKAQRFGYQKLVESGWQFDLCHVHVLSRSAFLALALKKEAGIPYGITEHWSGYLKERNEYHGLLKKQFTKRAVTQASFVTTVSTYLKTSMQAHGLKNHYHVIPNVVDAQLFNIDKRNEAVTEVLFVGNLLQRPKKVLDILKVFAALHQAGEKFVLQLYGEGKDEAACRNFIEQEQLSDILQLKGTAEREQIGKKMGSAAFLVLFSEFENQPCVISEAQAAGIPVVVPDLPGIKEFMHEDLGLLFPSRDREAFKAACKKMLHTYQTYKRERIRDYALKTFSEPVIGKQFSDLYQSTLKHAE